MEWDNLLTAVNNKCTGFFFAIIPDNKMENKAERDKTLRNSLNFPTSADFLSLHVLDFGV